MFFAMLCMTVRLVNKKIRDDSIHQHLQALSACVIGGRVLLSTTTTAPIAIPELAKSGVPP